MWIPSPEHRDIMICSICGSEAYWDTDYGQQLFDYCPYCGAYSRIPKELEQKKRKKNV